MAPIVAIMGKVLVVSPTDGQTPNIGNNTLSENAQTIADQIKDMSYPLHKLPDILIDISKSLHDIKEMMEDKYQTDPPSQYVKDADLVIIRHLDQYHTVTPAEIDNVTAIIQNITDISWSRLRAIFRSLNTLAKEWKS